MAYLIDADYERLIQDVNVQQIISGNLSLKSKAELTALTEIKSYLVQKYDVAKEFTDTTAYNPIATYKGASRVYLSATFYNESSTYALNALVQKAGKVYKCTTAIGVAEQFTIANWQLLGALNDIFYAIFPKPEFNLLTVYAVGDQVYWKDKTYTCRIATSSIDHATLIQYPTTNSIPYTNVFPDDVQSGVAYWGVGVAYTVPANSILNTTYFTLGDNRNQQMVSYALDCAIYHLYGRIPPGIVPELRVFRYKAVISWLINVAKNDDITADLPKLQPAQGARIRYGSVVKRTNDY